MKRVPSTSSASLRELTASELEHITGGSILEGIADIREGAKDIGQGHLREGLADIKEGIQDLVRTTHRFRITPVKYPP